MSTPQLRVPPAVQAALDKLHALTAPRREETQKLRRTKLSDTERPWRGAIVALLGGGLVDLVATTVGPGFFDFGVTQRGQVVGLVIVALALTALSAPNLCPLVGAGIVVCGVISFPLGLGGLVIGAILAVLGGAMIAAWSAPPRRAVLRVVPAASWQRVGAFGVDVLLLVAVSGPLVAVADNAFDGRTSPVLYLIPFTVWCLLTGWCTAAFGWTPGKLFCGLRLRDTKTGEPPTLRVALTREVALLIGVCAAVWVGTLGFGALLGQHGSVNVVVLVIIAVPLVVAGLLALGRRRLPHDRLLRVEVIHQRVVLGPALARPAKGLRSGGSRPAGASA